MDLSISLVSTEFRQPFLKKDDRIKGCGAFEWFAPLIKFSKTDQCFWGVAIKKFFESRVVVVLKFFAKRLLPDCESPEIRADLRFFCIACRHGDDNELMKAECEHLGLHFPELIERFDELFRKMRNDPKMVQAVETCAQNGTIKEDFTMLESQLLRAAGRAEGIIEGEMKGKIEGEMKGKIEGKLEAAKAMLLENAPIDFIMRVTKLSKEQIEAIA